MENENNLDPRPVLGEAITELGRRELCELVSAICGRVLEEVGSAGYRGGLFPENIRAGEDGTVELGAAAKENWQGQELSFLAPEVFWNGEGSPASDVYSLGLLLYYAMDSGRLPFAKDGEELAHKRRMNGESFDPPKAAGRRLGEIVAKATRFQASERYRSVAELKAVLDSCAANPYLAGAPSAETVFHKSDEELSKVERMMVAILARDASAAEEKPAPAKEREAETPIEETPIEETPVEEAPVEVDPAGEAPAEELPAEEAPEEAAPAEEKPPVVELREEKNPELAPVVLSRETEEVTGVFTPKEEPIFKPAYEEPIEIEIPEEIMNPVTVRFDKNVERERKLASQVRQRRLRPIVFALVLCALLVTVAVITRLTNDRENRELEPLPLPTPMAPEETVPAAPAAPVEVEIVQPPEETAPVEHAYEYVQADVSWTEAQARCRERGGHLAVISSEEEFRRIVGLVESYGATNVWVGCRRVNGVLVWENDEQVEYYPWGTGEPSLRDDYDGADEDYLLLWLQNGAWVYNDSRNDPVGDYPYAYSGRIGYVCEFDDGVIHQG